MNHLLLARAGLTTLCVVQGVATLALDLNQTHATNPLWPGHARFHVVWQTFAVAILSIVEVTLLWRSDTGFYLAAVVAAVSPAGFLLALACARTYGGTLSDPNGIAPLRLRIFGAVRRIDMNLVAVLVALMTIAILLWLFRA